MDFIDELQWRGMLQDHTPGVDDHLKEKKAIGYIGFDPTAPSITIGNYVQVMILKLFQLSGHQPIILMGGATGRIGDPSGKDEERSLKSEEELDSNLESQIEELKQFLDFEGPNKAIVVNNLDFYKDMNVLEFLRKVGKVLTVNYMLSKESVKNRMETGISFTEFSYQLLQAYDFQKLFEEHDCTVQMGGSDQWGNITAGTEFIRRNLEDAKVYAVTTPLLTKADGTKFGKSTEGNIWISSDYTSPYRFYQFWINAADADIPKFLKYFSLKSREEIIALINKAEEDPRAVKEKLADELTARIHSKEALTSAKIVSEFLFNPKAGREDLEKLSKEDLKVIAEEIPSYRVEHSKIDDGIGLLDLMAEETDIASSKGEARRLIKGNAVSINKEKIQDFAYRINAMDLIHGDYILLDKGKKNKFILVVE
jgi:tyrosyl-tRNA synthetase